jgi:hypothetical protein
MDADLYCPEPGNGMHPIANSGAVIINRPARRMMPGVKKLVISKTPPLRRPERIC